MEDTLEKRIMKSNLSDDDKIEIIQRLKDSFPRPWDPPVYVPCCPQPAHITYGPYLSNSGVRC